MLNYNTWSQNSESDICEQPSLYSKLRDASEVPKNEVLRIQQLLKPKSLSHIFNLRLATDQSLVITFTNYNER